MYENCINCPHHRIVPDPDPTDWFNADDEAIVCSKKERGSDLKSKYGVDRQKFQPVDVGLRPYQTKNVKAPDWCPISKATIRDNKLKEIIK